MKYSDYTVADFVADEYFEQWVNRPDPEVKAFWEAWLAAHPEKEESVAEARRVIRLLKFNTSKYSKFEAQHLLNKINATIVAKESLDKQAGSQQKNTSSRKFIRVWSQVAAITGLLLVSIFVYFMLTAYSTLEYTTQFGEKKVILLPDSSKVTLNANSSLRYHPDWSGDALREVYLDGEAFFEVRKQPYTGKKFVVHTDKLDVEVLGTQFNVSERAGTTIVTLNEGSVQLNSDIAKLVKNILMQPGEQAALNNENDFEIRKVNIDLYSSWKDNKLIFENTTIQEIARIIEDNYGLEVVVLDAAIFQRKFTGTLPGNNIDIILRTLSEIYGLEIERNDPQIFLNMGK